MKKFLQIFYFLSGASYGVLKYCSYRTRIKYSCLSLSLVFAVIVSFFAGFEIAAQFTSNMVVLIGTGTFWSTMILVFDLILINSGLGDGLTKWLRISVGLANSFLSLTSLLVMLNQSTIDGQIALDRGGIFKSLDNAYLQNKEERYAPVTKQKEEAESYNSNEVKPEAANGFPGPNYTKKKAAYDAMMQTINAETIKLNSLEKQYFRAYQAERSAIALVESKDFFIKASYLPMVFKSKGWLMLLLAFAAALVIGYVELQTVALKISMKNETEYPEKEKELDELKKKTNGNVMRKTAELEDRKRGIAQSVLENGIIQKERDHTILRFGETIAYTVGLRIMINGLIEKGYHKEASLIQIELDSILSSENEEIPKDQLVETVLAKIPKQTIANILQFTENMKPILDVIIDANSPENLPLAIFEWLVKNIEYQYDHGKFFYRTSREVWNDGRAICGETCVLYMTFLREIDIKCNFVAVSKDNKSQDVLHACLQIEHLGEVFFSDPAYRLFKVEHEKWEVWSDDKLVDQYNNWNEKTFAP